MELNPHDLLRIYAMEDLVADLPFPDWANEALLRAPYVVVRRAELRDGMIPVGVRGPQRGQRIACWLPAVAVSEVVSPYDLSAPKNWKAAYSGNEPATVKALQQICVLMKHSPWQWGPTGSTAFELATGFPAIRESSDLDMVIHVPGKLNVGTAITLLNRMEDISAVRLDIQLNTPPGGVSLKEFVGNRTVLVKTSRGPEIRNVNDLWA